MDESRTRPLALEIELPVLDETVSVQATCPQPQLRLDQALPVLYMLDDKVIDVAVRQAEAAGKTITCRKGCSTCCRAQPVPVTPPEAAGLAKLVDGLPEPRRTAVRERFANRVAKLKEAGLHDAFWNRSPAMSKEQARELAQAYFRQGLVCPFLEDDACSIYADRPFVCRQYLMTSPAEFCRNPFENPVEPVPMPLAPATAMLQAASHSLGKRQYTMPLILALNYAEAHSGELAQTFPAEKLFRQCINGSVDDGTAS